MATTNEIIFFLLQAMLLIEVCKNENKYCQEAVNSLTEVKLCPTSKKEWDDAARRKDCSSIASKQNCSSVEQFQYHCVIDGYRRFTFEVCAPTRIIFGHCAEFNVYGGVIQDQISAPCNDKFPKCDSNYRSVTAYKYPDCYKLVVKGQVTLPTPPVTDTSNFILPIGIGVGISVLVLFVNGIVLVLFFCKKCRRGTMSNAEESKTLMIKEDVGQDREEVLPEVHVENNLVTTISNQEDLREVHVENNPLPPVSYREEVLPEVHVEDNLVTPISNREVLREVHVKDNLVPPISYKNLLRSLSNGDEPYNFLEVGKKQRIKNREEVLPEVHVEDNLVTPISNREEVLRDVHVEDNLVPPISYKNLLRSLSHGDEPYNILEVGKKQRIKSIQRKTALF